MWVRILLEARRNLQPTPKAFGAALTASPGFLFRQKQEGKLRILLSLHFEFQSTSLWQGIQFQGCDQFQTPAEAAGGVGMALPMMFKSPVQIRG